MRFSIRVVFATCFYLCSLAGEAAGITPGADTATINRLLLKTARILDPDSAIVVCNEIVKLSQAADYADGAFSALMAKGIKYYEKEDYVNLRESTTEALHWAARSSQKDAIAWCYNNIGESYFNEGDYTKASEYFYIALQELKKLPPAPTHTAANIYNMLGQVNMRLGQPEKAMVYFNMQEGVAREGKLYFQLGEACINKGQYYNSIHKPDSAVRYFTEVMDIGQKINKIDLQASANNELGKTFIEQIDYAKAVKHLETAISLAKNKYPYIVLNASYTLGDALYRMHNYKRAEAVLDSALSETKAHNIKDKYIQCYTKLLEVYKATGQYKKALDCMDSITILKDALTNIEKAKSINLMDIKYRTVEKDKEIFQNQLLIAQQKNKLARKNIWIISIVTGVSLLTLLLVMLYRNVKQKERLQAEQIKTLQKENTIGILKGVVQGEENERGRLARELHDGIGGMLSAAMMRFMSIRHDNESITRIPAYHEAMNLLDEMGDEIRKTAHNLMPDVLLKQTLPEAVRSYCNSVQEGGELEIDFQCYGAFDNLTQDFKLNVYRIIQELLKNITEHAHASHVLVQLMKNENILTITVEDNGNGFDTSEVKDGIGLYNLQTRVRSMEGHYTLESEVGKGTSVFIEFDMKPLPPEGEPII